MGQVVVAIRSAPDSSAAWWVTMTRPDDSPLRAKIADDLRRRIATGELRPGGRVPPERQLAREYDVSRETVHAALERLVHEGLVTSGGRRRGRTVRAYDPLVTLWHRLERGQRRDDPALALDDWAAGVQEQGRTPAQVVTVTRDAAAPAEVARWLHLEPGAPVVRRHRMRYVDGLPWQVVDSWFPADVARTAIPGTGRQPLLEDGDVVVAGGILRAIGHPQLRVRDELSAWPASPEVAHDLDLPPGTAVFKHVRVGFGAGDRPVRVMVTTAAGDRNVFAYEMDL
jgi:DNA-binding GntR family transcriptional regulator